MLGLDLSHFIDFKQFIEHQGLWGQLAFVFFYVLGTQVCFSSILFILVAGSLFEVWQALLLVHIGALIASSLGFLFSRYFFRSWVKKRWSDRLTTLSAQMERNGFYYILVSRMIPIFPFCLANLLWGATSVRGFDYLLATFLGKLPGSVIIATTGHILGCTASGIPWNDMRIWRDPFLWIALGISFLGVWQFPRLRRKMRNLSNGNLM